MERTTDPTRRDLLVFGITLAAVVAVGGLVVAARTATSTPSRVVWGAGGALVLLYAAVPLLRRPVFLGTGLLTWPIGWVVSHVVLLATFLVVFTPIGLALRATGRDALQRRAGQAATTWWTPHRQPRTAAGRWFDPW